MGIKSKIRKLFSVNKITYCNIISISEENKLSGKVFVITGGGSGIGKEIAAYAVNKGAYAIIVGRNADKLKAVCHELGEHCNYCTCDITDCDYAVFFEKMEALCNRPITNFINNAGVYVAKNYSEYNANDFETMVKTNFTAAFFLAQNYIKYCINKGISGNLVFTGSNRGLFGDTGPYGMAKAGIVSMVQGFARDCAKEHIRVNAVAPGMTASDINHVDIHGNLYAGYVRGERIILPQEIAEIVCFLSSDASNCINGAIIPCDNGDYLR